MFSSDSSRPGRSYLAGIIAIGVLLLAALGLLAIDRTMQAAALDEARSAAQNEAAILAAGLESELDKFSLVPLVLARDPQVQSLMTGDSTQRNGLNQRLAYTRSKQLEPNGQLCRFNLWLPALLSGCTQIGNRNRVRLGHGQSPSWTIYRPPCRRPIRHCRRSGYQGGV